MINEAIETLSQGVADVYSIDQIMKLGMGHPMGPLRLADLIGLDVCLSVLKVLENGFGDKKYSPNKLIKGQTGQAIQNLNLISGLPINNGLEMINHYP